MICFKEIFAIQDNEGRYVDQDSIHNDYKTGEWCYMTYDNYYAPCHIFSDRDKVSDVVKELQGKVHNLGSGINRTFCIRNIS